MFKKEKTMHPDSSVLRFPSQRNLGISLLEISIVMVIVGLITGGIFIGQTLIRNAQIRNSVVQEEAFTSASKQFSDKYAGLPGDLYKATSLWTGATSGNGNGRIEGTEEFLAWQHLSRAGVIDGVFNGISGPRGNHDRIPGVNVPLAGIPDAGWGFIYIDISTADNSPGWWQGSKIYYHIGNIPPEHVFWLGGQSATGTDNETMPIFTAREAFDIDRKMDDGYPGSGSVLAQYNYDSPSVAHCKNPALSSTSRTSYNLINADASSKICALAFKSGF